MHLFTHVKVESGLLPPQVKELAGWQTRDVVEPSLETLRVVDRRLVYEVHDYGQDTWSGVIRPTTKHTIPLDYHGEMRLHTYAEDEKVELIARFNCGELFWIRPMA